MGIYVKAACTAILFANDMKHVHLHSAGQDFDKTHNLTEDYYWRANTEVDYLCELAIENGENMVNPTLSHSEIGNWEVETSDVYSYSDCLKSINSKLSKYLDALKALREATDKEDIKSRLDDMVRGWNKELDYKMAKRSQVVTNFIKSTVDDETVKYAQEYYNSTQKGDGLLTWD